MKKKLIILGVVVVIIITILLGVSLIKKKDLKSEYMSVFNNRKFILDGKKTNLKDVLEDEYTKVEKYSFVDYGQDSHEVTISGAKNEDYVFNYQGNKMYAYKLDENINSNSVDGYSSVAGDFGGWIRYTFNKKKMNKEKIIYIDYQNEICEYKNEIIECSKIVDKKVEFLKSIGDIVEEIEYTE